MYIETYIDISPEVIKAVCIVLVYAIAAWAIVKVTKDKGDK